MVECDIREKESGRSTEGFDIKNCTIAWSANDVGEDRVLND